MDQYAAVLLPASVFVLGRCWQSIDVETSLGSLSDFTVETNMNPMLNSSVYRT